MAQVSQHSGGIAQNMAIKSVTDITVLTSTNKGESI